MCIRKVDDDNLVLLANRFSHADEVVGFKRVNRLDFR